MLVSTLLTLLVIPVLYYAYHYKAEDARPNPHTEENTAVATHRSGLRHIKSQ
jgi:hypothetical protein